MKIFLWIYGISVGIDILSIFLDKQYNACDGVFEDVGKLEGEGGDDSSSIAVAICPGLNTLTALLCVILIFTKILIWLWDRDEE
jgi:hypothetical protein